jgi:hypothetical protein
MLGTLAVVLPLLLLVVVLVMNALRRTTDA